MIAARANAMHPNMGLTTWKSGAVRKSDVVIAKNYLTSEEIHELNRIVVMFLDFAEDQARRRKQVFLNDWKTRLDDFLRFNDRAVLPNAGQVSREQAERKATGEYDIFAARRRAQLEEDAEMHHLETALRQLPARNSTPRSPKP